MVHSDAALRVVHCAEIIGYAVLFRVRPRAITGEEAEHIARVLFGDAEMLDYLFCRDYTKAELEAISQVCRSYQIPLFMDGAQVRRGRELLRKSLQEVDANV